MNDPVARSAIGKAGDDAIVLCTTASACAKRMLTARAEIWRTPCFRPMDQLLIVTTGGTIDKIYFDDKSDY